MKASTATTPTMLATSPAAMESAPRPGPTVRSSRIFSGAGKAPARSSRASCLADSCVKEPRMMPEPPQMASVMRG